MDRVMGQTVGMDREGRQELHYRALEGDVAGIRERLAAGDEVGLADRQGFTALHFAAQESQTEAVRVLVEAGAPVDARDRFGNTPLWRAVFSSRGKDATVEALVEAGADPDIVNEAGASPRELAGRIGADEVAALFAQTH
ncbi:ankyrin repeat protein [Kribbella pratensis]|uniref:Ankyrin repeat protein n=2 Tax=Kribbella pratensis TaxID=2512112 RepID=A0A4V3GHT8_9ACTN|nr:ankyrin repeat protein [Kribbella pratensis]